MKWVMIAMERSYLAICRINFHLGTPYAPRSTASFVFANKAFFPRGFSPLTMAVTSTFQLIFSTSCFKKSMSETSEVKKKIKAKTF